MTTIETDRDPIRDTDWLLEALLSDKPMSRTQRDALEVLLRSLGAAAGLYVATDNTDSHSGYLSSVVDTYWRSRYQAMPPVPDNAQVWVAVDDEGDIRSTPSGTRKEITDYLDGQYDDVDGWPAVVTAGQYRAKVTSTREREVGLARAVAEFVPASAEG